MSGASNTAPFSMMRSATGMNPASQQPQMEQMHPAYMNSGGGAFRPSPPPFQSIPAGAAVISHTAADQKRKRGRPRKYGPDGSMNLPFGSAQQPMNAGMHPQQQNFSPPSAAGSAGQMESLPSMDGSASPTAKKARGRPRGSRNKAKQHSEAVGSNGIAFVPHVLNVNTGEDVSSKIMSICQNGPRAVCVLSANGTIATAMLRQTETSGGTVTYEGPFDILSLSGSFMQTEVEGQRSKTGGLSVALAKPDGTVLGGSVAGLLVAASPAQIIVGSFLPDGQREVSTNTNTRNSPSATRANQVGGAGASSSPSRGTLSESSGGAASPLNLSSGAYNNAAHGMSGTLWKHH